jgi:hypothetical protein
MNLRRPGIGRIPQPKMRAAIIGAYVAAAGENVLSLAHTIRS